MFLDFLIYEAYVRCSLVVSEVDKYRCRENGLSFDDPSVRRLCKQGSPSTPKLGSVVGLGIKEKISKSTPTFVEEISLTSKLYKINANGLTETSGSHEVY